MKKPKTPPVKPKTKRVPQTLRFKMRDGSVHIGYLDNVRTGFYYVVDLLDEEEVRLKREDIEQIGGIRDGFNHKDYPVDSTDE